MPSFIAQNLKYLRRKGGFTQEQFADKLTIKRSLLGAYEEARAVPKLDILSKLSDLFSFSIAELLNHNLVPDGGMANVGDRRGRPAGSTRKAVPSVSSVPGVPSVPLSPRGGTDGTLPKPLVTDETYLNGQTLRTLTVQATGATLPTAEFVSKASLPTYAASCQQAAYIAGLPQMTLPFAAPGQVYRAFELTDGYIAIGRYARNWYMLNSNQTYILVSEGQVTLADVDNRLAEESKIVLVRVYQDTAKISAKSGQVYGANQLIEVWELAYTMHESFPRRPYTNLETRIDYLEERLAKLAN